MINVWFRSMLEPPNKGHPNNHFSTVPTSCFFHLFQPIFSTKNNLFWCINLIHQKLVQFYFYPNKFFNGTNIISRTFNWRFENMSKKADLMINDAIKVDRFSNNALPMVFNTFSLKCEKWLCLFDWIRFIGIFNLP